MAKDWRDMDGDEIFDTYIAPGNRLGMQVTNPSETFKNSLADLARAVTSGGDVKSAARAAVDAMGPKREKPAPYDRTQRLKDQPQTLRQLRGNQYVRGGGWKPNAATVKDWAKQNKNKSLDGSGASECFSEFSWQADSDDNDNGTLSVTFARNNASYQFADVSREDFFEAIGGSEGGWWNASGLYGNQI
jgi:hypothetical protein